MSPSGRGILLVDLDGVVLDNDRYDEEWRRLAPEAFVPRLGGEPGAWAEAQGEAWRSVETRANERLAAAFGGGRRCRRQRHVERERPFFHRPRRGAPRGAARETVPLARVFDALVRAGHGRGHEDVARRLTWRQIELFWREAERRDALPAVR